MKIVNKIVCHSKLNFSEDKVNMNDLSLLIQINKPAVGVTLTNALLTSTDNPSSLIFHFLLLF